MTWMMVAQAQSTVNTINLDGSKLEKDVTKGTLICASTMNLSLLQQINCIFSQSIKDIISHCGLSRSVFKMTSSVKYIVQQYVAASGGQTALNSINSMYAVGQSQMPMSDIQQSGNQMNSKRTCEDGGFVLWQKNSDLWFLELVISDCNIDAGSYSSLESLFHQF